MDIDSLIPVIGALLGGGAIAFYTARPRKDSIIAEASEKAIAVVTTAIARLEADNNRLRERIAVLEAELTTAISARDALEDRVFDLGQQVALLGGDVKRIQDDQ